MYAKKNSSTLGVVTISRNEEHNMQCFLEHLLPWVDEIVIVDDGSTDRTKDICLRYKSKVKFINYSTDGLKNFAQQRNIGIDAANSDWLLHVDVDIRVPPGLAYEIRNAIANDKYDAYRYKRLNFFLHRPIRGGGWERWNQPWLARRGILRFEGSIHEKAVISVEVTRVGQLLHPVWHLNDRTYISRLNKSMLYSKLEADKILAKELRISWMHLLLRPIFHFVLQYIIRKGFIDGIPGLILALHSANALFRVYAIAWDEQNRVPREALEDDLKEQWNAQVSCDSIDLNDKNS